MKSALSLGAATALFLGMTSAYAADVVVYEQTPVAPTVIAPTAFDWTGPYIGLHAGLGTGDFDYEAVAPAILPAPLNFDISGSGFIGGAQVGYDWQTGNWVFGAVADIAVSSYSAEISGSINGNSASIESELQYLGTVRARAGYAFDRALIYAHGGFAFGETEQTIALGTFSDSVSQSRTGWTVGAGAEFAITNQVTFGTEYSYVDLGTEDVLSGSLFGAPSYLEEDLAFHTLKATVNFRF